MAILTEALRELREATQQGKAVMERLSKALDSLAQVAAEQDPSAAAGGTLCPYDEIVKEWNARCAAVGMAPRNTPGTLKAKMLLLWRRYPSMDLWRAAFDACANNDWWKGGGGWRGNLESFLRASHSDKFFDEAIGAAAPVTRVTLPSDASGRIAQGSVEEEIDELLRDPARPLPSGCPCADPREVRGKDEAEFVRRHDALAAWMATDWRFAT